MPISSFSLLLPCKKFCVEAAICQYKMYSLAELSRNLYCSIYYEWQRSRNSGQSWPLAHRLRVSKCEQKKTIVARYLNAVQYAVHGIYNIQIDGTNIRICLCAPAST